MSHAIRLTTRPGDQESTAYRWAMRNQREVKVRIEAPHARARELAGIPVLVDLPDDDAGGRLEEWELSLRG